ncbi:MAG: DUF1616 domain-containing protein [Candidatus Lokiarchaeota archaeon]|nr:DUF1616 domain-containing protein [Candidatus Lokiarchaeota archaeon]
MSKIDNNMKDLTSLKKNYKEFDKILKILLIIGIIIISGFIIYAVLTPKPGYITFGVLNSDKKAENYPTNATVGENITFYASVGNYLNRDSSFRIEILKGNNETIINVQTGSLNAISYINYSTIDLSHGEKWISSAYNVNFTQPGYNRIIIAELWETNIGPNDKYWAIFWLRLNITS